MGRPKTPINLLMVEKLAAAGLSATRAAEEMCLEGATFIGRLRHDEEVKAAWQRGVERRSASLAVALDQPVPDQVDTAHPEALPDEKDETRLLRERQLIRERVLEAIRSLKRSRREIKEFTGIADYNRIQMALDELDSDDLIFSKEDRAGIARYYLTGETPEEEEVVRRDYTPVIGVLRPTNLAPEVELGERSKHEEQACFEESEGIAAAQALVSVEAERASSAQASGNGWLAHRREREIAELEMR